MTTAGSPKDPRAAADCFASILDAEAQAREAIRHCHEQHDEAIRQAQAQVVRIRRRAGSRVERIQAAAAARVKALVEIPISSIPASGTRTMAGQGAQLQAAVDRLAAQLTGAGE